MYCKIGIWERTRHGTGVYMDGMHTTETNFLYLMTRLSSILSRLDGDFYERVLGVFLPCSYYIFCIFILMSLTTLIYIISPLIPATVVTLSLITAYSAQWRCQDSSAMVLSSGTSNPLTSIPACRKNLYSLGVNGCIVCAVSWPKREFSGKNKE